MKYSVQFLLDVSTCVLQQSPDDSGGGVPTGWQGVPVPVQSHGRLGVARPSRDCHRINPRRNQVGDVSVAQVMEPDPTNPSTPADEPETVREPPRLEWVDPSPDWLIT